MKCDEMKTVCYIDAYSTMPVYCAREVDAAIAELKEIIEKNRTAYYVDLGVVADDCEKLKAENERLNRQLEHVKNGDCINTCDVVEKHVKEELKAKRALWLARAYIMTLLNRDFQRLAYQCNNGNYKTNLLRRRNRYFDLSEKCLKKAEEYK